MLLKAKMLPKREVPSEAIIFLLPKVTLGLEESKRSNGLSFGFKPGYNSLHFFSNAAILFKQTCLSQRSLFCEDRKHKLYSYKPTTGALV